MDYIDLVQYWGDNSLKNLTPPQLEKALKNCSATVYLNTNGRTFQSVLDNLNNTFSNLNTIFKLIEYFSGRRLYLSGAYRNYSAAITPSRISDIVDLTKTTYSLNGKDYYRINIVHIPRGTSFLTQVLTNAEESKEITRLKTVELNLIANPTHYIKVFQHNNAGHPSYTIITNWVDTNLMHKIILMIPVIIGWGYHNPEDFTDQDEEVQKEYELENTIPNLFEALYNCFKGQITADICTERIKDIYNTIIKLRELDKINISAFMNKLANNINEQIIARTRNEHSDLLTSIASYESKLETFYARKAILDREITFQEKTALEDTKPFAEALTHNKAITILEADEEVIKIKVTAPLQFFTSSDFERYEKNTTSYLNTHNYWGSRKYALPVFHKIFVTHEYKLMLSAIIKIQLGHNYNSPVLSVNALSSMPYVIDALDSIPNPHLFHFDCWDKTKNMIQKAITDKNYDLIPILIINSVQTVNIAEPQSFFKLLDKFGMNSWVRKAKLLDKDNQPLTWREAIEIEKRLVEKEETPEVTVEENTEETLTTVTVTTNPDTPPTAIFAEDINRMREALAAQAPQAYTQVVVEDEEIIDTPVEPEF